MIAPYSADHEPSTPIQNRRTGDVLPNGSRISLDVMERESAHALLGGCHEGRFGSVSGLRARGCSCLTEGKMLRTESDGQNVRARMTPLEAV